MRRVSLQMSEELGREPTDEELAEEIGIASGKVSRLKRVSIRPASLDAPISDDDSTAFGEIVGDEEAQTPFELFRDKNMRDEVSELLEALDDRERKIIFQRFGLDGGKPKTRPRASGFVPRRFAAPVHVSALSNSQGKDSG